MRHEPRANHSPHYDINVAKALFLDAFQQADKAKCDSLMAEHGDVSHLVKSVIDNAETDPETLQKLVNALKTDFKIASTFEYKLEPSDPLSDLSRNYAPYL